MWIKQGLATLVSGDASIVSQKGARFLLERIDTYRWWIDKFKSARLSGYPGRESLIRPELRSSKLSVEGLERLWWRGVQPGLRGQGCGFQLPAPASLSLIDGAPCVETKRPPPLQRNETSGCIKHGEDLGRLRVTH